MVGFEPQVRGPVDRRQLDSPDDQHLLALVVLLKCYQRLGYVPKLTDVPAVVVDDVRGKLDLADDVNAEVDAERVGIGTGSSSGSGPA